MSVKAGIVGNGLFVEHNVRRYGLIAEYTGNRVSDRALERLHWAVEYHGQDPNSLVEVPSDKAVIDPRVCGNEGKYANHSCDPNARLVEIDVRGKTFIFTVALRPIKAGEEILIEYEWYSERPGSTGRVPCHCGNDKCRHLI